MTKMYKIHRQNRSISCSYWHMQWCTKYRRKIFTNYKYKNLCVIFLHEIAKKYKFEIIDCEVDVDHVHVIALLPITMLPTMAVQYLKGMSARGINIQEPYLRKFHGLKKHFWSPGKFVGSVGHITLDKAKTYLEEHHGKIVL